MPFPDMSIEAIKDLIGVIKRNAPYPPDEVFGATRVWESCCEKILNKIDELWHEEAERERKRDEQPWVSVGAVFSKLYKIKRG